MVKTWRSIRDAREKVNRGWKDHLTEKICDNVACRVKHISRFPVCGYQMIKHSLLTSAILNTEVIQRTDTNHRTKKQLFLTWGPRSHLEGQWISGVHELWWVEKDHRFIFTSHWHLTSHPITNVCKVMLSQKGLLTSINQSI